MSSDSSRIDLNQTYGASFIGLLFTAMLYGLTNLQTYLFYSYFPNDKIVHKLLVATVWVLDTLHMVLASIFVYYYLVTNYANPSALTGGHWSLAVSVMINSLISFLVHLYFLHQIFRLSNAKIRWWLALIIGVFVLAHCCFGIETGIFMLIKHDLRRLHEIALFGVMPFALFTVIADILIAAALSILLYGSRVGYRRTNTIVTTLIIYAVNRCILTSLVAIVEVTLFATSPTTFWFMALDFVFGKLYANSLLASLNTRDFLRAPMWNTGSVQMTNTTFEARSQLRNNETQKVFDLRPNSVAGLEA